ncbi:MAG: nuclear transport factor 2 family protein [Deltaproteobacteria bacterium]|nr:nuclear transport factor 2 family protein [Deltaproteobacteria bacterium]
MSHRLTHAEAVSLFDARRKAWLEENAEAYLALWAEDMEIEIPGREIVRGKAAYAEMIQQSFATMRPLTWEFHRIVVDEDHVLSEWTIAGELRRIERSVTWRGMSTCRIAGGLIQVWREYWDPAALRTTAR